jgi:PTH1 family peptidyl-tRNA hydrolase
MILIIGLGNPGPKFQKTKHNIGFIVIDQFSRKKNFPNWEESKKNNCLYTKKEMAGKEIELIKPLAFMNNSGRVVKSIVKKHYLKPENIVIAHDDIDLDLGKIKIVKNRGAAGHKGVQSIINELGTKNFIRIRIGIRPQIRMGAFAYPSGARRAERGCVVRMLVLQKFTKEEEKILKPAIEKTVKAIEFFLKEGLEKTMSEFNR